MDNLTKDVIMAKKMGLSYGNYKARVGYRLPDKKPDRKIRKCRYCGIPLNNKGKKFCSFECEANFTEENGKADTMGKNEESGKADAMEKEVQ